MTVFAAPEITKDRLRAWQKRNERESLACTPALLLNVRHEPEHLGQLVINTTEDLSLEQIRAFLMSALKSVEFQSREGK